MENEDERKSEEEGERSATATTKLATGCHEVASCWVIAPFPCIRLTGPHRVATACPRGSSETTLDFF